MSKILVITSLPDPHVDMVSKHLEADVLVFDPKTLIDGLNITYHLDESSIGVLYKDKQLNDCDAVWFRKPLYLEPQDFPVEHQYQKFAHAAYKTMVKSLYDILENSFWLSDYRNIMKANNKSWQLIKALNAGFRIPETLVTNNPKKVQKFRSRVGDIITKSLTFSPVLLDDKYHSFFTTLIGSQDQVDLSGLSLSPAIFQEAVKNKVDLRITVVENEVFPCLIRPYGSVENDIDWRVGIKTGELTYEAYDGLDGKVSKMCIELTKELGLHYSAIDLALDDKGEYWFLEINPNGQWAFIEIESGLQISKSIANLLSSKSGS